VRLRGTLDRKMPTTDEAVLAYIGLGGRSHEEIAERFPGFEMTRLVRAHLVTLMLDEDHETEAHVLDARRLRYVLTSRGASALGVSESRHT
jgi:hypothetical protein